MGEQKVTPVIQEQQLMKQPKTFTILQSIVLLVLSFVITAGAGYALGHFYFWNDVDMQRVNQQLKFYEEKVKADPANLGDRVVLGYTHFVKGNNKEAIKQFMYVLDQDENYFDAHYNLGLVYRDEKRYDEALSSFNRTIQIAPKDFKGHVQLGITYREIKKYDEALEALNKANQLTPANADVIYQIGLVAEEKGDPELAVEIYKDALQYDPLFEEAVEALERLKKYDTKTVGE